MNKFYIRPRHTNTPDKRVQRTLYFAYGMNTNHGEMATRCPDSTFLGTAKLHNHRLTFQGVADFTEHKGHTLHGALWLISATDELALDRLEGYPHHYGKKTVQVSFKKGNIHVMIYQMVARDNFSVPFQGYEDCLRVGYKQSGMNLNQISEAISHAGKPRVKKYTYPELLEEEYNDNVKELDFTEYTYMPTQYRMRWK